MRYYIIAGEASGDMVGGNLVKALRAQDPMADIRCWGGDRMQAAGATLVKHYRELAFMGFVEVIMHLRVILRNMDVCKKDIAAYQPDVLVLIDYPGFNMRIAEWAKAKGIKVVYYVSPQVWAWKENRVKKIKRDVDKLLVILPFEVDYYKDKWGYDVTYVGNPMAEVVGEEKSKPMAPPFADKPLIALLPGSRSQEIKVKLPIMLKVVEHFPDHAFIIAQASAQPDEVYKELIGDRPVLLAKNQTYDILRQATAALVTSGTATLETALFGVPQVVCYKGNPISFWLATKLVNVKYISLVNLIMDKLVVKELIQDDLTEANLVTELKELLNNQAHALRLKQDYDTLWQALGGKRASAHAAAEVIAVAKSVSSKG